MADSHAHEQSHPYHLVDPSPWPLIGALSAFVLAAGALLVMHENSYWLLAIGAVMVMGTMFGWWRDVTDEAQNLGHHNKVVQVGRDEHESAHGSQKCLKHGHRCDVAAGCSRCAGIPGNLSRSEARHVSDSRSEHVHGFNG